MQTCLSRAKFLVAIAYFAGVGFFIPLRAQVTFTPLGLDLGRWIDVTDDGKQVVALGFSGAYGNFRWTKETGTVDISNELPLYISRRIKISGDGSTVTGTNGQTQRVFRSTPSGGVDDLGTLAGHQWYDSRDLSRDGRTIVGEATFPVSPNPSLDPEAFRWTESGGMKGLGALSGDLASTAFAVSADGSVVAGSSGRTAQAIRWTEETGMQSLGNLGASSRAFGINPAGTLIVGSFQHSEDLGTSEAFRWTQSTGMVGLGLFPNKGGTSATGTSADGSVIIGDRTDLGGGFIWTPESGMRDLLEVLTHDFGLAGQMTNWTWLQPMAVTPDGRYITGLGAQGGWLLDLGLDPSVIGPPLTPIPEPTTYAAAASLLLVALAVWRRRLRALPARS